MKQIKKIPTAFLFIFCSFITAAYGQATIKGKVTDDKKQALPSVVIQLKRQADSTLYKTVTCDQSGNFTFDNVPPGAYTIKATLVGYQTVVKDHLTVSAADTIFDVEEIALNPSSTQLREVSVTAQTPLVEKLIDRTVVNVDQNIANAGSNALEVLKKLPGVQISPDGQITLNGKSGVNVTIDGKTTYLSADDLAALLASMPSSDIQKVEIMTNPSAKYDAEGTGGIINLIRKKSTKAGLNGSATGSFGQGLYDGYNGGLVLNYKTDQYNLYLNNSYGYNKGYMVSYSTGDIMNGNALSSEQVSTNTGITANKAFNTSAGLDLYLSKRMTLTLTGNVSDRRYYNNLISTMTFADSNRSKTGSENFTALNLDKPINFSAGVQLAHKLDTAGRAWSADVDYSDYTYNPGQYNTGINYDSSGSFLSQDNVFIGERRMLHIFGARVDYTQPLPGNGKLETGLKSSYVKTINNSTYYNQVGGVNVIDSALSDYDSNTENINAAYVNFNRQYQKLTVQAGLRAEQTVIKGQQQFVSGAVDQNYFELFPTLFLADKLNDQNTLNFQFGRRTDRPDYHEYVPFRRPLSATLFFQGNPNLKPDLNWHTEFTWAWQNTFFITAAYDVDRNYMRTLLYLDSNKTTITRMPTNIQGAHSWSVDISYNKELAKWFSTNTSANIYRNSFSGTLSDGFSANDPGLASIDLVSNNSFRANDRLSFEADFEYESRRDFVETVFGAYSVLDLAVKQKILHEQGSLTLTANDVFNSESRGLSGYSLNLYQHGNTLFFSRAVILTFSYRFGSGKLTKTQSRSGSEEEQRRAGN